MGERGREREEEESAHKFNRRFPLNRLDCGFRLRRRQKSKKKKEIEKRGDPSGKPKVASAPAALDKSRSYRISWYSEKTEGDGCFKNGWRQRDLDCEKDEKA